MESKIAEIVKDKYDGKSALLLGNGLNRVSENNLSWEEMLGLLIKKAETKTVKGNKPLTFLFEEILHGMTDGATKKNIKDLKFFVREAIEKKLRPNKFHIEFTNLSIEHILTTNYDYCLEKALDKNFERKEMDATSKRHKSSKYSLGRRYQVQNKFIWHIHGELNNGYEGTSRSTQYPEHSIMLGFDQYATYLNMIYRKFNFENKRNRYEEGVVKNPEEEEKNRKAFEDMINNEESWLSLFFTRDIHIVGLEMGLFETHIWWLLNLRANLKDRRQCIKNNIYYYIPSYEMLLKKDQMDLLKSLHVTVTEVHCEFNDGNYFEDFYEKVLNILKKI